MVYWVILHPETDAAEPHEQASASREAAVERLGPFESRERARAVGADRAARGRQQQQRSASAVRLEVVCDYA